MFCLYEIWLIVLINREIKREIFYIYRMESGLNYDETGLIFFYFFLLMKFMKFFLVFGF